MRWPWQRRTDDGAGDGPSAPARGSRPPVGQTALGISPSGWAFFPPLQRTIAAPPSTTRPHDLAAWRNPSFTGPLTHAVSPAAPSGVIDGDGGGVGTPSLRAPSGELPLLVPPRPTVQRSTMSASSESPAATPIGSPLTTAADLTLPLVQTILLPGEPDSASAEPAAPPYGDVPAAPAQPPRARTDIVTAFDNGGANYVPLPGPPTATALPMRPGTPAAVQRAAELSGRTQSGAEPPAVQQPPRRLGLGAPLPATGPRPPTGAPAAPTTSGAGAAAPGDAGSHAVAIESPRHPSGPAMPVQRSAAAREPDVQTPAASPAAPVSADAPLLGTPAAALSGDLSATSTGPSPTAGAAEPLSTQRVMADAAPPVRHGQSVSSPLVSSSAPIPALPLVRSGESSAGGEPDAPPILATQGAATTATTSAAEGTSGTAVVTPDEPATDPEPALDLRPVSISVQRDVGLITQRVLTPMLDATASPAGPARSAATARAERSAARPVAPGLPARVTILPPTVDLPVPTTHIGSVSAFANSRRAGSDGAQAAQLQRTVTGPGRPAAGQVMLSDPDLPEIAGASLTPGRPPAPPTPPVADRPQQPLRMPTAQRSPDQAAPNQLQRVDAPAPEALPEPSFGPPPMPPDAVAVTAAPAGAAAAPGAAGASSPEELDRLASRLVGPLTRRLKAELLIDRERRGVRSDPR